jgi:hypothetical protein
MAATAPRTMFKQPGNCLVTFEVISAHNRMRRHVVAERL